MSTALRGAARAVMAVVLVTWASACGVKRAPRPPDDRPEAAATATATTAVDPARVP